ncbi:MAG: YlbF family regulator, partial [Anaeroplasmataceae bacterium]|nr:YlbF family regulator [Anaeroplasmataceae bacterium]
MNELKKAFLDIPEIKRLKELEFVLDSNPQLNEKILALKDKQKQMVNAKEYHQLKQYNVYSSEYDQIYQEILDFPFVEEYLDLLELVN